MTPIPRGFLQVLRIHGVSVRVHWSLPLFALAVALVMEDRIAALAVVMSYMGLVVVHELGHWTAARSLGLRVHALELVWLGGLVRIDPPRRPRDVAIVYGAGVAAQFVVLVAASAWLALSGSERSLAHEVVLGVLVLVNAIVIGINLFPVESTSGGLQTDGTVLWKLWRHVRHGAPHPLAGLSPAQGPVFAPETSLLGIDSLRPRGFVQGVELLNDDTTPMDLVVHVLQAHVGLEPYAATAVMLDIHLRGGALVPLDSWEQAERVAAAVGAEVAAAGHRLACRAVRADATANVAAPVDTARYRDSRFDGHQLFELGARDIKVSGKHFTRGKFAVTVPLWLLSPVVHRRSARPGGFSDGVVLLLAWPVKAMLELSWSTHWGGFLVVLGGIGAVLTLATLRRVHWAEFRTRSGTSVFSVGQAGPQRREFEAFVAEVVARIEAQAAPTPAPAKTREAAPV